jgi:hypothetical protein
LKSSFEDIHKGTPLVTNSWGFRDKEYELPKPANTFRIGVFGGSYVVGAGTDRQDLFNQIVNVDFNKSPIARKTIEMINMATPGYHILHNLYMAEAKGLDKDLDIIAMVSHGLDYNRAFKTLSKIVKRGSIPYPFIADLLEKYQYEEMGHWRAAEKKYSGMGKELVESSYSYLADICKKEGIIPMYIIWPRSSDELINLTEIENITSKVKELGYLVLDLRQALIGFDSGELYLASFDRHPNKLAHRLIAEEIIRQLRVMPEFKSLVEQSK